MWTTKNARQWRKCVLTTVEMNGINNVDGIRRLLTLMVDYSNAIYNSETWRDPEIVINGLKYLNSKKSVIYFGGHICFFYQNGNGDKRHRRKSSTHSILANSILSIYYRYLIQGTSVWSRYMLNFLKKSSDA